MKFPVLDPSFAPPNARSSGPEVLPLRAGAALGAEAFAAVRERLVLGSCKWDPQVGDVSTLSPFPLLLRAGAWGQLAGWAEAMARETLAAEAELLASQALQRRLAVPRRVRRVLRGATVGDVTPAAARVMRFDFHWTTEGWRISEVNSDVPGGFCESSDFTAMLAGDCAGARPAGNPTERWADAVARAAGAGGAVALLAAPGYMEDQQVTSHLAAALRRRGCRVWHCGPANLRWDAGGRARLPAGWTDAPLDAVVRFYQCEWLARLPRGGGWPFLFRGGGTPVGNPGTAVLTESKRFPLAWDALRTPVPMWRRLLPETRDPRDVPWRSDDGWVLKTAYCNTGDTVSCRGWMDARGWRRAARAAFWNPGAWVAQRRFEVVPVDSPVGPVYPCVGVYVIDGAASGIYGRYGRGPVVDFAAVDVAVLVESCEG